MMIDFPLDYKIVSTGLFAGDRKTMFQRQDDDILMVFGNVGGMMAFVAMFFKFFVERFADLQLRSYLVM